MATSFQFPVCLSPQMGSEKLVLSCRVNCCLILTLHPGTCFGFWSCTPWECSYSRTWLVHLLHRPVWAACKFSSGSGGMIMSGSKRWACCSSIFWTGMKWRERDEHCHYISPAFPFIPKLTAVQKQISAVLIQQHETLISECCLEMCLRTIGPTVLVEDCALKNSASAAGKCFFLEHTVGTGAFAKVQLKLIVGEAT